MAYYVELHADPRKAEPPPQKKEEEEGKKKNTKREIFIPPLPVPVPVPVHVHVLVLSLSLFLRLISSHLISSVLRPHIPMTSRLSQLMSAHIQ